jgi:hypothetical protein
VVNLFERQDFDPSDQDHVLILASISLAPPYYQLPSDAEIRRIARSLNPSWKTVSELEGGSAPERRGQPAPLARPEPPTPGAPGGQAAPVAVPYLQLTARPPNSCVLCWKTACPGYTRANQWKCRNQMHPRCIHAKCGHSHPWQPDSPRLTPCGAAEPWPRTDLG